MMLPKEAVGIINYVFLDYEEDMILDPGDYLVLISYKYDHEEEVNYEINILSIDDGDTATLLNDTYEGQEYFEIIAYTPLDCLPNNLKMFGDRVSEIRKRRKDEARI